VKVYSKESELNQKLLNGVKKLSEAVGVTLGPKGRNVIIHQKGKQPFITKDGVTVAAHVDLEDPFENAGAQVLKQVSQRTVEDCGDGTTTSTILASAMLLKAQKYITAGSNPSDIKRGMEKAVEAVCEKLKEMARPVSDIQEIENIASISANNDRKIGKLIATAIDKAGVDGAVTIEEGRSAETKLDIVEGFQFDAGYASPQFITDERKGSVRYENALILVTDQEIEFIDDMMPVLEIAARDKRPLVIVAESIEGQALAALIMNVKRGTLRVMAIKAPRYGQERKNLLSDLAVSVGALFVNKEQGMLLRDVKLTDLGGVKHVESLKNWSTFVGGKGRPELIEERIESLKAEIAQTDDINDCGRIQDRITRLASGVAIISVGGVTEVDMTERKHRIEDALEAVKSAQQEGILPGGGLALLRAAEDTDIDVDSDDERFGIRIVLEACYEPLRKIAENCGIGSEIIIDHIIKNCAVTEGYDFSKQEYVDMLEKGIIDPAKVTRCALQNAASAASTLLTTNYAIIDS
jgi:chaperonin GroEL